MILLKQIYQYINLYAYICVYTHTYWLYIVEYATAVGLQFYTLGNWLIQSLISLFCIGKHSPIVSSCCILKIIMGKR